MNKSEFKVKFKRFYDTFGDFLNAYEKNNPEWMSIAFSQILYNSIINLKALIESQKEKGINWDNPYVELRYPMEANWKKLTPVFMTVTDKDLEDIERKSRLFAEGFLRIRDAFIFRALTKEILTIIKGDKYFYRLTVKLEKKLNKLSEKERKNKVDKLINSITKSIKINFIDERFRDGKGKEKRIKGSLIIQFNPCVINADEKEAYYPIFIGIKVKGDKPAYWDKKTRELLWRGLLQGVKNAFPKEVLDFKLEPLPEPTARPVSKEEIKKRYPIVKIDRTTEQDLLPIFLQKKIFTNYSNLLTEEDLIELEKKRLNKNNLSFEEERAVLSRAGEYKSGNWVIRDYGNYAIGFSCMLYLDYIQQAEKILREVQKQPCLYDDMNKKIEEQLKRVSLYRMAQRLARLTLSEVYTQRKTKELTISKGELREKLGYSPDEKQVYRDIKESYKNLMFCSYQKWNYVYTDTQKKPSKASEHAIGTFIYNLKEDSKSFTLDVNEKFVGCVNFLLNETLAPKTKRKEIFGRGYFTYPTRTLTLTRHYPLSSELLTNFLISERGNQKLNKPGMKVIAYKVERFAKEANITHIRKDVRYRELLDALEKVEIKEKVEPGLEELKKLKPATGLKTTLYVYVKSSIEELDELIASKIKEKSNL